jgi:toxin YoeB
MNWRKWRMSKISFTEDGIGKPEPLRGNLNGFWSRRIDGTNRLVYRISGENIEVVSCRYHYDDK